MTQDEALEILLENVTEWHFEDDGRGECSSCWSCGWNTREHWTAAVPMGHHPGCKLREAIDRLKGGIETMRLPEITIPKLEINPDFFREGPGCRGPGCACWNGGGHR